MSRGASRERQTYLTTREHSLIKMLGDCASEFAQIATGELVGDQHEFTDKIHQLQHTVMAQAASRAYPDRYRLLGESPVKGEDE